MKAITRKRRKRRASDLVSRLFAAKRFARQAGGIEPARQALRAFAILAL